jgi:hypothetical protein
MHDTDRDSMTPPLPTGPSPRHGAHAVGHDAHHGAVDHPGGHEHSGEAHPATHGAAHGPHHEGHETAGNHVTTS